jgi:hypothetical protein
MKKFCFCAAVCAAAAGFAAAEPIGLTAGLEAGLGNVADSVVFGITPGIEYENSFGDFDVYAGASYTAVFEEDDTAHDVYLEAEGAYNLPLGTASVLSFILNNSNDFHAAPDWGDDVSAAGGTLEGGIQYTQTFGFGDVFVYLGFPVEYAHQGVLTDDDEAAVTAKLTLGMAGVFGFGAELTFNYALSPDAEYGETELLLSYENGAFYGEVGVIAAQEFESFAITPEFDYSINDAFTVYVNAEFGGIGGEDDISVTPALGVKYHF